MPGPVFTTNTRHPWLRPAQPEQIHHIPPLALQGARCSSASTPPGAATPGRCLPALSATGESWGLAQSPNQPPHSIAGARQPAR